MRDADVIILTFLFLTAFTIWTLPIKDNPIPFGEPDASYNFMVGDYQGQTDNVITKKLPSYIGYRYYDVSNLGPFTPVMLPPSYLNVGIMQVLGGDRTMPVLIYIALVSFFGLFSVYFISKKLFGTGVATIAAFGTLFSFRTYMSYLWGQWPTLTALITLPIVVYTLYEYLTKFYKKQTDNKLLIITALLLISQYVLHFQGFILTGGIMLVTIVLFSIKYKKIPLDKTNITFAAVITGILLIIILSTINIYIAHSDYAQVNTENLSDYGRLLRWYFDPDKAEGYPAEFKNFSGEYSYFLLIPLILGIIYTLVNRRKDKYLLLLSWIIGFYLVTHLDFFLGTSLSRIIRFYIAENYLFFILASIGALSIPQYIKVKKQIKNYLKIAIIIVMFMMIIMTIGVKAHKTMDNAYDGLARITPQQYEAAEWIRANTPEDSKFFIKGPITYAKERFFWQITMRPVLTGDNHKQVFDSFNEKITDVNKKMRLDYPYIQPDYVILDFSDLAHLSQNPQFVPQIQALQKYEQNITQIAELVYNKNNIHIYKLNQGAYSYE